MEKGPASQRVLLAESDWITALNFKGALSYVGYNVTHVEDGEFALDQINQEEYLCAIIGDPIPGLSGLQIAKHCSDKGNMLPIFRFGKTEPDQVEDDFDQILHMQRQSEQLISTISTLSSRYVDHPTINE